MIKRKHKPRPKPRRRPYLETAGLPPGSLVHTGERKTDRARVTLVSYSPTAFSQKEIAPAEAPGPDDDPTTVQWVHMEGLHDVGMLEALGGKFGLHRLVLENILNMGQRPKIEDFTDYLYTVVKVLSYDENSEELTTEQMSFVLGNGFLLTFAERPTGVFAPVLDRIKNDVGRIRKMGPDYLLHALLDVIVDGYFVVLEDIGEKIEYAEDELISRPTREELKELYSLKRSMLYLHKAVWPFREVVGALERGEARLVREETVVYLRDLYDHVIQVMDSSDTLRDILSSMMDIYLSSVSNRMNEIMKVLTIISTVFIPLTFIVGVYGMNLIIPETTVKWFYPVLWCFMLLLAGAMLLYFKRKKWW